MNNWISHNKLTSQDPNREEYNTTVRTYVDQNYPIHTTQLQPDLPAHATTYLGMGKDAVTMTLFAQGYPPLLQPLSSAYSSPQECCGGLCGCWTAAGCSHRVLPCPSGELAGGVTCGSHFLCAPVEYVVVGVAQLVEESSEEFPQVGVVRLVLKPK